jgi:hypothetical protein
MVTLRTKVFRMKENTHLTTPSDSGPAWPESRGFGLAFDGFGFQDLQAGPKLSMTARLWLGSAQAAA